MYARLEKDFFLELLGTFLRSFSVKFFFSKLKILRGWMGDTSQARFVSRSCNCVPVGYH